jgi:hypothetical protein
MTLIVQSHPKARLSGVEAARSFHVVAKGIAAVRFEQTQGRHAEW